MYFKFNSANELTPESYKTLERLYEKLKELPANTKLNVVGHTDIRGGADANYQLSLLRAEYVSQLLANHKVAQSRMHLEAKGETDPMVEPAKAGAARRNRRVEISIP